MADIQIRDSAGESERDNLDSAIRETTLSLESGRQVFLLQLVLSTFRREAAYAEGADELTTRDEWQILENVGGQTGEVDFDVVFGSLNMTNLVELRDRVSAAFDAVPERRKRKFSWLSRAAADMRLSHAAQSKLVDNFVATRPFILMTFDRAIERVALRLQSEPQKIDGSETAKIEAFKEAIVERRNQLGIAYKLARADHRVIQAAKLNDTRTFRVGRYITALAIVPAAFVFALAVPALTPLAVAPYLATVFPALRHSVNLVRKRRLDRRHRPDAVTNQLWGGWRAFQITGALVAAFGAAGAVAERATQLAPAWLASRGIGTLLLGAGVAGLASIPPVATRVRRDWRQSVKRRPAPMSLATRSLLVATTVMHLVLPLGVANFIGSLLPSTGQTVGQLDDQNIDEPQRGDEPGLASGPVFVSEGESANLDLKDCELKNGDQILMGRDQLLAQLSGPMLVLASLLPPELETVVVTINTDPGYQPWIDGDITAVDPQGQVWLTLYTGGEESAQAAFDEGFGAYLAAVEIPEVLGQPVVDENELVDALTEAFDPFDLCSFPDGGPVHPAPGEGGAEAAPGIRTSMTTLVTPAADGQRP